METKNEQLKLLQAMLRKYVGARVAKARATMNYAQSDVLAELGRYGLERTQGSLSQIETGKRLPSVEMLYVLAKYLNTSTDFFVGLTDNELSKADIEEDIAAAKGESRINRLMKLLSPPKQQQVVEYTEFLIEQHRNNDNGGQTLTQRQRDLLRAQRVLDSVDKEFGGDVRLQLEKIIRAKGNDLSAGDS